MPENNNIMSLEGQLCGIPLAGPESFSAEQLAYLKRALGVDETVLWEGTYSGAIGSSNYITLSEAPNKFKRILITNGGGYKSVYQYDGSSTVLTFIQSFANTGGCSIYAARYSVDQTNKKITCTAANFFETYANGVRNWANRTAMDVGELQLTKIIGIGRKGNA